MTRRWAFVAAMGSAGLLLGALAFQYWGGLAPCKMCIWQRWPHGIAIALGLAVAASGFGRLAWAGALAMLVGAGVALYHTGVEQAWWEGPTSCTSGSIDGISAADLLDQIMAAPVVRCDEIAWSFAGLSMASWNGLASLVLAGIWVWVAQMRAV